MNHHQLGVVASRDLLNREPWYVVPHVHVGDAFLSYMSSSHPKLFLNNAKAVAPNTLHVVRFASVAPISPTALTIGWYSSLTSLSCEIEGHSMGGGMLKLEPRESARVLIPALPASSATSDLASSYDKIARKSGHVTLQEEIDSLVARAIGLSHRDLARLREATVVLRERRTKR